MLGMLDSKIYFVSYLFVFNLSNSKKLTNFIYIIQFRDQVIVKMTFRMVQFLDFLELPIEKCHSWSLSEYVFLHLIYNKSWAQHKYSLYISMHRGDGKRIVRVRKHILMKNRNDISVHNVLLDLALV